MRTNVQIVLCPIEPHAFFSFSFSFLLSAVKDAPVQSNHMNNLLSDMYRTSATEARGSAAPNDFPIDISSDESDIDEPMQKNTNNGKRIFRKWFGSLRSV